MACTWHSGPSMLPCAKSNPPKHFLFFRADFSKPARPDTNQYCRVEFNSEKSEVRLVVESNGMVTLNLHCGLESVDRDYLSDGPSANPPGESTTNPPLGECRELRLDEMKEVSGSTQIEYSSQEVGRMFPDLLRVLPGWQLGVLLATTRIVGMECPGLNSIYMKCELDFSAQDRPEDHLMYRVTYAHQVTGLTRLSVSQNCVSGELTAAFRPKPVRQPCYEDVRRRVPHERFSGQQVLIIGGSRGLGEVAVKICAAGGAKVVFTYARGHAESLKLVEEIREAGGQVSTVRFDAYDSLSIDEWLPGGTDPTALMYFASPYIELNNAGKFDMALFLQYGQVYLAAFGYLVEQLKSKGDALRYILYPSSSALDETMPRAREYIAVKAAGEALCDQLRRLDPSLKIATPRFPRLLTDQTSSVMPYDYPDTISVLLPVLCDLIAPA